MQKSPGRKPVEAPDEFGRDELRRLLGVESRTRNAGDTAQRDARAVTTVLRIAKFRLQEQAVDG